MPRGRRPEDGNGYPGRCELLRIGAGTEPGPLQDQPVLLTADQSH